jgi:Asp-tRNA(Asn)/Glu-tRNA(Gln) amidotransferase A subunit family amidase
MDIALKRILKFISEPIQCGALKRRLPAERVIAEKLNLSRTTVREKLAVLQALGFVTKSQGSGTYLNRPPSSIFQKDIFEIALKLGHFTIEELEELRWSCAKHREELKTQMVDSKIDLWICPSATGPAPEGIHATGDPNMNLPWTHAGMPAITIPCGRVDTGLPLGLQFIASFGADEQLLAFVQQLNVLLGDPLHR